MFIFAPLIAFLFFPIKVTGRFAKRLRPVRRTRMAVLRLFGFTPRKLWAKALRSGKYTQTNGTLANQNGYCCLGVACEVYQKYIGDLNVVRVSDYDFNDRDYHIEYDGSDATLPDKVCQWLDIERGGSFEDTGSLIVCNDELKMKFSEIADLIEDGGHPINGKFNCYNFHGLR